MAISVRASLVIAVAGAACAAPRATAVATPPATVAGAAPRAAATPPLTAPAAATSSPVEVRFLARADRASPWRPIDDPARLAALRAAIDNEPARFALALYAVAWELAPPPAPAPGAPILFIGVEEGGNHAEVGLTMIEGDAPLALPQLPYLRLGDDRDTLRGTLLHETGHAIHALLARARADAEPLADGAIAPIPHSIAAVTDRRTALAEGLAISLEAIAAHCGRDPDVRRFYDHASPRHGPTGDKAGEYFFAARDLMTYAQTFARYQAVRDGAFGFEPALRGDYLRVQLDPARDLRTLRDPGSLVASEGFVASVLFQLIAADGCGDDLAALAPRYRALWQALATAETSAGPLDAAPLLDVVAAQGAPAIAAFLDLSHGATVDADAAAQWAALYDAALTVDVATRKRLMAESEPRRARWLAEAIADPAVLARRLGPVVRVEVAAVRVRLVAFGDAQPLRFDVNAGGAAMLELVPGWDRAAVATILAERRRASFASYADLIARLRAHRVKVTALAPG